MNYENHAVRHKRWVDNGVGLMVLSHTGQNIVLVFFSTHIAALKGWNQKASELEELINQNLLTIG